METLDQVLTTSQTTIAKDLRLNLAKLLESSALDPIESHLTLLALSTALDNAGLAQYAEQALRALSVNDQEIQEARESAALMGMLNTYYKFRQMIQKPDDYKTAGLRMMALAKPILGKERFEMLAFSVSVLNGCESCIRSHEDVLRRANLSVDKIHDLARLAAVAKGMSALK